MEMVLGLDILAPIINLGFPSFGMVLCALQAVFAPSPLSFIS